MKFLSRMAIGLTGLILFIFFFYIGVSLTQSAPKLAKFITGINTWEYQIQEQTVVYYSDQKEMGHLGYRKEYSEDFPSFMKEAVVAVEDRRFYQHSGFDAKSIGRAVWNNLRAGRKAEGGSTITQQLARTLFLSQEKTYSRKIKEVFIASAIEDKYTKDAVLNMYLNEIYMGRGCSGMACAAQSYFGKDVFSLNQAEITFLVGIIQAPEYYSPDRNMERAKKRQQMVVNTLTDQGLLSAQQGQEIMAEKLNIRSYQMSKSKHPYYMAYLSQKLEEIIGAQRLYGGGLKIYTTLDSRMQDAAEKAVREQARSLASQGINARDLALVSVEPQTGAIKAMVGGVDWEKNQVNMAVLPSQPGSAIKPLYYAAALNEGVINPDSVLNNRDGSFNGWPRNYSKSPDKASVKEALVHSYNVASVEVLNRLGVAKAVDYLKSYGITSLEKGDEHLALGLGGMVRGISPLQLASAYCIFPAQGRHESYYTVDKILDSRNRVIYVDRSGAEKIIKTNTAVIMDDILKAVVDYGTGTPARISIPAGGKTGTTENSTDLWFVGYSSDLVTAVWAGNSNREPVKGYSSYGGTVCGPVWRNYMNSLLYNGLLEEKLPTQPVEETPEEEIPEEDLTPEDSEQSPEEQPLEPAPGEGAPETGEELEPSTPPAQPPNNTQLQPGKNPINVPLTIE